MSSEDDSDPYSLSFYEDKGLEGTYTENMDRLLEMHVKQRVDVEILLKKKIKRKFQQNDVQINQGLFDAIRRKHSPVGRGTSIRRRRSVRSTKVPPTAYLQDGLTPRAAVCMTDGSSNAGKTAFEIEKCIAIVEGRGCFDRDHPVEPGNVLFVASDSGANDFFATVQKLGYDEHPALKKS